MSATIKTSPTQQAIKAGANPAIIAERVVNLITQLDNDPWVDVCEITEGCSAIASVIIEAIARQIEADGLYPDCAFYYGESHKGLSQDAIVTATNNDNDQH